MAKNKVSEDLFKKFVGEMDGIIRSNEITNGKTQKELLNALVKTEKEFRRILISTNSGKQIYKEFVDFIMEDKSNMLSARVYFRERQDTFSFKIFNAFHKRKPEMLFKYKINFLFASWAIKRYRGLHAAKLKSLLSEIAFLRKTLCENNLPLAINRAKIFWSKTAPSHLEYMDLIQTSSEGLLNAIDKFVPPYRTVFRSVAIGRMNLNMSTDYSDTIVVLPPKDKRILYRANKAKSKKDNKDVVKFVNESFSGVSESDIQSIEAAANQLINIDEKSEGSVSVGEKLSSNHSIEESVINSELIVRLILGIKSELTTLERKLTLLIYGDIDGL